MRSLFFDVLRTVNRTIERSAFSVSGVLEGVRGISRSWYYSQLSPDAILDGRFNPYTIGNENERLPWLYPKFNRTTVLCSYP